MAWIYLFIAGLLEIAWAIGMKLSEGFTRPLPSVLTILGMIVSFALLSQAMRELPAGTAYAMWTGIGALGTAILGIVFLGESPHPARLICIALIAIGLVGLKFTSRV